MLHFPVPRHPPQMLRHTHASPAHSPPVCSAPASLTAALFPARRPTEHPLPSPAAEAACEAECVGARGCCWDAAPGAGPQCFNHARAGTFNATFPVAPLAAGACFDTTDVFGFARGRVCAEGGAVSVTLSDGPLYLALAA